MLIGERGKERKKERKEERRRELKKKLNGNDIDDDDIKNEIFFYIYICL